MVDVIIPAYNAHDTIKRTLSSIAYQTFVDRINVLIINDASDVDYSSEIDFFKNIIKIKEIKLEKNSGPGVARQIGIDNSDGKYIVFIDSDDVFFTPLAIEELYNEIETQDKDMIVSSFYSQEEDYVFSEKVNDVIWLHGKIYRRKFLEDNNIRFNTTSANEDNGFNQLIYLNNSRIGYINNFTYVWCKNDNSITRINNKRYKYTGIEGYIYNVTWALEEVLKKDFDKEKVSASVYRYLLAIYYYYLNYYKEATVDEVILKNSKELKKIYDKYHIKDLKIDNFILCDQYLYLDYSLDSIDLKNPILSFQQFLDLIEEYE